MQIGNSWKKTILLPLLLCFSLLSAQSSSPFFNVRDYGATGAKNQKATTYLQAAIDAAAEVGGGTVYLPPGDYLSGSLVLQDNLTLYLEAGATLWASQEEADYPFLTQASRPTLIYADSAHNISLRGKGTIHGQARRTYEDLKKVDYFIADITENARQAGVEMKRYYKVPPFVRLVTFESCTDITLTDLRIIESPSWAVTIKWSERIQVRGLYITSDLDAGVNSDGLDIDGCKDVTISDCIITTGDDAIVLKSSQGRNLHYQDVENVTVSNCVLSSTSTGLKIGTETVGDFRDIVFSNCVIRNTNRGLSIVVRYGGTVENVLFSNITIETNRKHFNWWGNGEAIWLVLKQRSPRYGLGTIRNVIFENIIAHSQGTSAIEGYAPDTLYPEGSRLQNIQLRNVQFHMYAEDYRDKRATHAFMAHDISGLALDNVEVHWDEKRTEPNWESAVALARVDRLRIEDFYGRQGLLQSTSPVIALREVEEVLVDGVEAAEGSGTVLRITGEGTREVWLREVDWMGKAKQGVEIGGEVGENEINQP
jgi:hypothetical protein